MNKSFMDMTADEVDRFDADEIRMLMNGTTVSTIIQGREGCVLTNGTRPCKYCGRCE